MIGGNNLIFQFLIYIYRTIGFSSLINNIKNFFIRVRSLDFYNGIIELFFNNNSNKKKTHINYNQIVDNSDCLPIKSIHELFINNKKSHSQNSVKGLAKYELIDFSLNDERAKQFEDVAKNIVKQIIKNFNSSTYVWRINHNNVTYFNLDFISPEDGACALACIYKIVGSNETGIKARNKAVQQLKSNINNPIIRQLMRSEVRGILLSNELNNLFMHYVITKEEYDYILEFKSMSNKLITYAEKLKIKYFGDQDLPINSQNTTYDKLFVSGLLDNFCNINTREKVKLEQLQQLRNQLDGHIKKITDDILPAYIDQVVSQPGFWFGVAGQSSSGVMGAVAQINQVNFRVLANNGQLYQGMPEITKICQHISLPNAIVHNIYLHTNIIADDVAGVQRSGIHFDLLREVENPKPYVNFWVITMHNANSVDNYLGNQNVSTEEVMTSPNSSQINSPKNKLSRRNSFYL